MNYKEAREFIESSNKFGSKLGLETISELLYRLGNPQDKLKVIHIAGTNGKGSTAAYIASILTIEGYRVGRYISPAVFSYRERIQISRPILFRDIEPRLSKTENESYHNEKCTLKQLSGAQPEIVTDFITEEGVAAAIDVIKPICLAMVKEGFNHPTSFEIETAMAFLFLYREQVDYAVIEVGMGGRLDATNVLQRPICCVITSISMDHMQYLGDTRKQIAFEKAGIIKKGVPVITGNKDTAVLEVLSRVCQEQEADLRIASTDITDSLYTPELTSFHYENKEYQIKLLGEHQINNAILAIQTAYALIRNGIVICEDSIKKGLLQAKWPGRFEIIARNPYFIIDGAHNEDAALCLKNTLQTYFPGKKFIYIMGVLADKEYKKILEITAPLAKAIITITPDNSRALCSTQLADEARVFTEGVVFDAVTIPKAVKTAYEIAVKEDVILAFGSLSYLGEIYRLLLNVDL